MQVIGVIDLRRGIAVHARGGVRGAYRPVETAGSIRVDGNPVALARFYRDECGLPAVYVADLDAIERRASQDQEVERLATLGIDLWVDSGVASVAEAETCLSAGATQVVLGLETLPDLTTVQDISRRIGRDKVTLSLDVKDGRPLAARWRSSTPPLIEEILEEECVNRIIVLDLTRVGSASGPDFELVKRVCRLAPGVECFAGGGVRAIDDVSQLAEAGASGVLVASALIDGTITPGELHPSTTR